MKLKFFSLVTVISIITTLMMAEVSTAQPNFLFDKIKDIRDGVEDREEVRDRFEDARDIREDRFDNREDIRDRLNSSKRIAKPYRYAKRYPLGQADRFSNFPSEQVPFSKRP